MAIMDWHSRRVLPWRLSNRLDTDFCVEVLEEAFASASLNTPIRGPSSLLKRSPAFSGATTST